MEGEKKVYKKRGRPKKSANKKQPKQTIQTKKQIVEKEVVKEVVKKEEESGAKKVRALIRITHKGKTYEPGDVFEEGDPVMVEQIVNKKFGELI